MKYVKKIMKDKSIKTEFGIKYPFYAEKTVSGGFHIYLYNDIFMTENFRRVDVNFDHPFAFSFNLDIFY